MKKLKKLLKTIQNEIYKSDIINSIVKEANKNVTELHVWSNPKVKKHFWVERRIREKIEHVKNLLDKMIKREALVFKNNFKRLKKSITLFLLQ